MPAEKLFEHAQNVTLTSNQMQMELLVYRNSVGVSKIIHTQTMNALNVQLLTFGTTISVTKKR